MDAQGVKSHFLLHEVVVLTGFTKYMLDYLARENIFRPSDAEYGVRGRQRLYSYADVVLLRALHRICGAKGKIRHLKVALAALRDEVGPLAPGQQIDRLVFVDGDELSLWTGKDSGRHLRTGQMTFGFVMDLRAVSEELSKVVKLNQKSGAIRLVPSVAAEAESVRQMFWGRIRRKRAAVA